MFYVLKHVINKCALQGVDKNLLPIWFQASTIDRNCHICSQTNSEFLAKSDTPVYMCFLDAKNAVDRVYHWTLAKQLLDRNVLLHIVKLFIHWYGAQEFMV